jgi:hypothetical protein
MARRQHLTLSLLLIVFFLITLSYFFSGPSVPTSADLLRGVVNQQPQSPNPERPVADGEDKDAEAKKNPVQEAVRDSSAESSFSIDLDSLPTVEEGGDSIAPKLENATLKFVLPSPLVPRRVVGILQEIY